MTSPSGKRGRFEVDYPNDLDVVIIRDFYAPKPLVFDAFTTVEMLLKTIAPFGEEVVKCDIDLQVGGDYHYIFLSDEGDEMSFRGTYLELDPPNRVSATWIFDGWEDVVATETMDFVEADDVTTMTYRLSFTDKAGRDHMRGTNGHKANFDLVEDLLAERLASGESNS